MIQEGSATFQQLLSPSVPVFKDIFFFNLTNPVEFEQGAKPNLVEVGPYSYRYAYIVHYNKHAHKVMCEVQ